VARVGSSRLTSCGRAELTQFRKLEKFPNRAEPARTSSRAKLSACTCISGPIRIGPQGHNRPKPSACTCVSWCDLRQDRLASQLKPAYEPDSSPAEPILVAQCTSELSQARTVSPPSLARLGLFPALITSFKGRVARSIHMIC
jgi:hypothetical protein